MLKLVNGTKKFRTGNGERIIFRDVSLSLAPGERLGLVGPSGTGKSTLAQVMALLMPLDHGHVELAGVPVRDHGLQVPPVVRRQIQLIWQSPRLASDVRLRLREIILEPLAANGLLPRQKEKRQELLSHWQERVGLTDELLRRFPHEVSDGQLQRACLARALVLQPRYIICDEMTSMLDVSTQASLLQTLADEQQERDVGLLLISHDRELVEHWCTRVIELKDGRLIER